MWQLRDRSTLTLSQQAPMPFGPVIARWARSTLALSQQAPSMQLAALDGLPAPPAVPQGSGDLAALGVATPAPADSGAAGRLRCCPCRGRAAGSRDDRRRPWQAGCCRLNN